MTTNEQRILSIVWGWGGEASVNIIAREAGISINYARLICESLGREDYIDFIHSKLCKIRNKGKVAVAEHKSQNSSRRKIIIPLSKSGFGLGKNKRGRLLLDY